MTYELCCIGHITLDKVVTAKTTAYMPGGTSFYFSNAISNMDVRYLLITSLAESEMHVVKSLQGKGIEVEARRSDFTVYFENNYSNNPDHRTQRVLKKANPFTIEQVLDVKAKVFHLGPLLSDDMSVELIKFLAEKGRISLDVQGFLRKVENSNVCAVDWPDKKEVLGHVHYLKANEYEMEVLTGHSDVYKGAVTLFEWGVKEVIITLGSKGSIIYCEGHVYIIPAYQPVTTEDTTGCGDTYMAGYLFQRLKGATIQEAGEFAAAMATLKIESAGPFTGTQTDVYSLLESNQRVDVNA